jgi:hypothetical protein
MNNREYKLFGGVGLASLLFILCLMLTTDPSNGGPILIICFLAAFFVLAFMGLLLLGAYLNKRVNLPFKLNKSTRYYCAISLATGFVYLIGLQTVGQLQLLDVVLTMLLETIINFYIIRRI